MRQFLLDPSHPLHVPPHVAMVTLEERMRSEHRALRKDIAELRQAQEEFAGSVKRRNNRVEKEQQKDIMEERKQELLKKKEEERAAKLEERKDLSREARAKLEEKERKRELRKRQSKMKGKVSVRM